MQKRLTIITLGVKNLQKMETFYTEKFGWQRNNQEEGIAFFQLNGIQLALYPQEKLHEDIQIKPKNSPKTTNHTIAINFNSEAEVDQLFQELREKGVQIVKEPQKVFWGGYSGYIKDPEDNYWELAYNPYMQIDADGNISEAEE